MSTASAQLRVALCAYVAYRQNLDSDAIYEAHMRRLVDLEGCYGRERVRRLYARYRGPVTILVRDGITYRRV